MNDERDPFAPPPEHEPTFFEVDVETTRRARLAERDPHAPDEESAEYPLTGAVSFDEVLRRARWQGFLAGAAAGAVAGVVLAVVVTGAVSRATAPSVVAPAVVAELPQAAPAAAEPWPTSPVPRRTARITASPASAPAPAAAAPASSALERALRRAAVEPASVEDHRAATSPATVEGTVAASGARTEKAPAAASDGTPSDAPAPAAAPQAPQPTTTRPPKATEVVAALGRQRDALDACVADMPGDDEAARGRRFRILVVVEPSGRVSEARAYDDAIAATRLGTCLVKLARDLAFPPFEGEAVRLEVPIHADDGP